MKIKLIASLVLLLSGSGVAWAQDPSLIADSTGEVAQAQADYQAQAQPQAQPEAVQPPTAPPDMQPPMPPGQPPPPPVQAQAQAQPPTQQASMPAQAPQPGVGGQWVYTDQYGWVWMPYGDQYTYEGTSTTPPHIPMSTIQLRLDVAGGSVGLGWGAYPYFGVRGAVGFGWYRGLYRARLWRVVTAAVVVTAADTATLVASVAEIATVAPIAVRVTMAPLAASAVASGAAAWAVAIVAAAVTAAEVPAVAIAVADIADSDRPRTQPPQSRATR